MKRGKTIRALTGLHKGHFKDIVNLITQKYPDWKSDYLEDDYVRLYREGRFDSTLKDYVEYIYVFANGVVQLGDWMQNDDDEWAWHPHTFSQKSYDALNIALRVATNWDTP